MQNNNINTKIKEKFVSPKADIIPFSDSNVIITSGEGEGKTLTFRFEGNVNEYNW